MKNDGIHPIIIDAGDLFFSKDDPDPLDLAQSKIRAKTIIEGYNSIGCEVMNIGSKDLAAGIEFLNQLKNKANFPFISSNLVGSNDSLLFKSHVIVESNGFSFGITGVTTLKKLSKNIKTKDVISSVNNILNVIDKSTDFNIVLFNGSYKEAMAYRPKFEKADYMFLSGDYQNPIGKQQNPKNGPRMYRLGQQGKSLGILNLKINDSSIPLIDITELKRREAFFKIQLDRLNKKDPTKTLEELYSNDNAQLGRIERIKQGQTQNNSKLIGIKNTSHFDFPPMNKDLKDDSRMLTLVNNSLNECEELATNFKKEDL
mgnify:FL=1|tara:strand:- start:2187 stop:3131 length:945 start_codon:yes stop_codon:yes gene_type:complete